MPFDQPTLQLGDSGPEVARLQEDLTAIGCFAEGADGSFSEATRDAVAQFQSLVGLPADGVVGPDTWAILEGPEASVEQSIDLAEFPGVSLALSHGSDEDSNAYLADLGVDTDPGDAQV